MRHKKKYQGIVALVLVLKLASLDFAQCTGSPAPLGVLGVKPYKIVDGKGRAQGIRLLIGLRSEKLGSSPRRVLVRYKSAAATVWSTAECKYSLAELTYSATIAYADSTTYYLDAELRDGSRASRFGDGNIDGTHLPAVTQERDWPLALAVGIMVFIAPFSGGSAGSTSPGKSGGHALVIATAIAGIAAGATTYLILRHKKRASHSSSATNGVSSVEKGSPSSNR